MKFDQVKIPDFWRYFWSKYPDGYLIKDGLEQLTDDFNKIVMEMNSVYQDLEYDIAKREDILVRILKVKELMESVGDNNDLTTEKNKTFVEAINNVDNLVKKHKLDKDNPHQVTKSQIGLSNVTNDKQATEKDFTTLQQQTNTIRDNLAAFKNDNAIVAGGNFIKYPNGAMVAWDLVTLTYGDKSHIDYEWEFPEPYNDEQIMVFTGIQRDKDYSLKSVDITQLTAVQIHAVSKTKCTIRQFRTGDADFTSGDRLGISLLAIGRWK